MTQPVTPWLPGQAPVAGANYGHLALPGISDGPAPYGMDPNRRHVIPDQVNLDGPVKPANVSLDESPPTGFGNRADGSPKGNGFLGVLKRPDGNISTELSIGVNIDGKEVEIPTLVPTLTEQEKALLLSLPDGDASKIPQSIVDKATLFARQRVASGRSPFADAGESPGARTPAKLAGGPLLPQPAAPSAPQGPATGWRVKNAHGQVVATIGANPRAGLDYQKLQVQNIGDSLLKQAVTPEETEAAQRATAFGLSLVGSMANDKIQAAIVHRYDEDIGNATKVHLQDMRTRNRGGGKGGPVGPSKADKFDNQVNLEDSKLVESVVNNEQQNAKVAALNDYSSDLEKLEQMISSPNALSQRGAIAEYLKTLTGKQSTDRERQQITGAAGKLAELENNLSLWSPNDASLSKAYVQEFRKNLGVLRNAVHSRKTQIGKEAGARLVHQPRFLGKDAATKKSLEHYGAGVVTGDYGDEPGVDEDLLK